MFSDDMNPLGESSSSSATSASSSHTPVLVELASQVEEEEEDEDVQRYQHCRSLMIIGLIFFISLSCLIWLYCSFPELNKNERAFLRLPRNMEDAKKLGKVLVKYKESYFLQVLGGFAFTYIFLQTFVLPGSIFLSILSGFLFPFWLALPLVCACSAIGASFCYCISHLVGRRLVLKYFPVQVREWSLSVDNHRDNLLNYIIFLRITPFLPNWFINVVSPIIGVPVRPFAIGTFIGVAPPSFLCIHAGTTLNQLTSSSDAISWTSIAILAVLAVVSLLPILFKDLLRPKVD